jgi:hypothetical protein
VADHDFLFALELSDQAPFDRMLGQLTAAVLGHVGYAPAAVEEIAALLRVALASGAAAGNRRCDVRFRAHAGQLHILVSYHGGAEWRTTRPLP